MSSIISDSQTSFSQYIGLLVINMVTVSVLSVTAVTSGLFGVLLYKLLRNRLNKREPSVYVRPSRRTNTWEDFLRSFLIGVQQGLELLRACRKCPLFSHKLTTTTAAKESTKVCTDEACTSDTSEPTATTTEETKETVTEFLSGMLSALGNTNKKDTTESKASSSAEKPETGISDFLIEAFSAYAPSLSSHKDLEELIALYKQVQAADKETSDSKDKAPDVTTAKQEKSTRTPRRKIDVDAEPSTD